MRAAVHELALMEDLVGVVSEETEGVRVHVVRLRVGSEACVSVEALRFCFDVCAHGTGLEGALLEVVEGVGEELRLQDIEVS
jgi:hydrogenase nickel incorporation protein HypA/HybF